MQNQDPESTPYMDEDFLFLMLNLIEYPSRSPMTLDFMQFKKFQFKEASKQKVFGWIVALSKKYNLIPRSLTFEGIEPWKEDSFEKLLAYMSERPGLHDKNIEILNFQMEIGKTVKEKIHQRIEKYIQNFIEGKLEFGDELYPSFSFHKEKILEFLKKYLDKTEKVIRLKSCDFENNFRFIETTLALETQGYFGLQSLAFEDGCFLAKIVTKEKLISEASGEKVPKAKTGAKKTIANPHAIHLPPKTRWQDIFLTLYDNFEIGAKIGDQTFYSDFEKFGLIDIRRNGKQELKKCWYLLLYLGTGQGVFAVGKLKAHERLQYQQRKKELTKTFKNFFPTIKDADPFEKWDKEKQEYKIKVHIIPPRDFRDDYLDRRMKNKKVDKFADWEDSFNYQTPGLYEQPKLEHTD